jgi:hypothetical protein
MQSLPAHLCDMQFEGYDTVSDVRIDIDLADNLSFPHNSFAF